MLSSTVVRNQGSFLSLSACRCSSSFSFSSVSLASINPSVRRYQITQNRCFAVWLTAERSRGVHQSSNFKMAWGMKLPNSWFNFFVIHFFFPQTLRKSGSTTTADLGGPLSQC